MDRDFVARLRAKLHAVNLTREPRISIRGSLVSFKGEVRHQPPPPKKSGCVIHEFSRPARLRMLKFVASVDFSSYQHSILITLTYPDSHADRDKDRRNLDRQLFLRKLEEWLGTEARGIWRIEWEPRRSGTCKGIIVPHFHLLMLGLRHIPYKEINAWWKSVIHATGYVRTDVRKATGAKGAGFYIAKYCAKVPKRASLVNELNLGADGKHYGYHRGRKIVRFKERTIGNLNDYAKEQLYQLACEAMPWATIRLGDSFTLLGPSAEKAKSILREMGLDLSEEVG